MSRLVFVARLMHSGLTVLDLLLGSHPRLVDMGEIVPLLRPGDGKLDEPDRRLDTDVRQGNFTLRDLYRKHGSGAWRPLVLRNSYARFLVWNRRIQKFMAERNLPVLQVGYEEFAAGSLTGMTVASLPRP